MSVLCLDPLEIFASKIVALMNRSTPRDLYDVCNMVRSGLFSSSEQDLLRKSVVFYSAISSDHVPEQFSFEKAACMQQMRIKTELLPVLRKGEHFDLNGALNECLPYLTSLMVPTPKEQMFLYEFSRKRYCPELLFETKEIVENIKNHPMALWKCREQKIADIDVEVIQKTESRIPLLHRAADERER